MAKKPKLPAFLMAENPADTRRDKNRGIKEMSRADMKMDKPKKKTSRGK